MRFKAVIIIVVLALSQVFFDSCCKINTSFTINGVSVSNLNNSGSTPEEIGDTTSNGVSKNAYGIRVFLSTSINSSGFVYNTINNLKLIDNSYALGCKQHYSLTNMIKSFKIFTLNDFDDSHKAGADVTEYFNGLNKEYGPYITIQQKINEINSLLTDLPEYFDIFLMKPPTENGFFRFKIMIELNDGYIEDLKTENIILF